MPLRHVRQDDVRKEPSRLRAIHAELQQRLEKISHDNYRAFVQSVKCVREVRSEVRRPCRAGRRPTCQPA